MRGLSLAAVAATLLSVAAALPTPVTTAATVEQSGVFCSKVRSELRHASQAAEGSAFCSSLFHVGTKSTSTVTKHVTAATVTSYSTTATATSVSVTQVVVTLPAVDVTSAVTVTTTATSIAACKAPVFDKHKRGASLAVPSAWSALKSPGITGACSCLALPTRTKTVTTVYETKTATVISYTEPVVTSMSTSSYTPTTTLTVTSTVTVQPQCTTLVPDGDFSTFPEDLYGLDDIDAGDWVLTEYAEVGTDDSFGMLLNPPNAGPYAILSISDILPRSATIAQNISALTAGTTYTLSFDILTYEYESSLDDDIEVDAVLLVSYNQNILYNTTWTKESSDWQTVTVEFTADVDGGELDFVMEGPYYQYGDLLGSAVAIAEVYIY